MFGISIALLTTLSWSFGVIPFTEATRRLGVASLNQYRLLLAWIIISCLTSIIYKISVQDLFVLPQSKQYVFLGLSGIIGFTIGDYFTFSSFKMLGPRLGSLYYTFAPAAALLAGYLILGETINFVGIAAMLLTINGVIWLTLSKKDRQSSAEAGFKREPMGVVYGIAGALCQGFALVLSKLGMASGEAKLPTLHAVWIRLLFAFGAAFLISLISGNVKSNSLPVLKNQNKGVPYLVLGTLFGPVLGVSLSLLTIQHLEVGAAQTVFSLLPIMVLPINRFYYQEKLSGQSIVGVLLAVFGVLLLIWRDSFNTWI